MKNHYIRYGSIIILLLSIFFNATAAPYRGDIFTFNQPDGSEIKVKVWGDEFYQRVESIDGYTLVKDAQGWLCYALLSSDGNELVSTGIRYTGSDISTAKKNTKSTKFPSEQSLELNIETVRNIRSESKQKFGVQKSGSRTSGAPQGDFQQLSGNVKGLAILIDFSDEPSSVSSTDMTNLFNQTGFSKFGNNGSIRDYFYEVSGGKLTYTNQVLGYYRSEKPRSYYTDVNNHNVHELMQEALRWADSQIDFSTLTNIDGEILAINFMYTGNAPWKTGLWPHKSSISFSADGVYTGDYQITNIDPNPTIATLCHENGHMLFNWPDFYDTDYNSSGLGNYCLMAYQGSSTNPVYPNAFLRYNVGWETPTVLNGTTGAVTVTSNALTSYVYNNPSNSSELFIIESRLKTGRHASLPDEGLMIWHVDLTGRNSRPQMTPESHYMIALEQADGRFDLENYSGYGDDTDLFGFGTNTNFTANTLPNSRWWNGTASGLNITNISAVGPAMTFELIDGTPQACSFGTPLANALPTMYYTQYSKAHVIGEGGPNLNNMRYFAINWDLSTNGLYNFAFETTNGVPNYYVDLKMVSNASFGFAYPTITISNSNVPGLDGHYYVGRHNGNFVMAEESGQYTIYFSNSTTAPTCPGSAKFAENELVLNANLSPNPATDFVDIQSDMNLEDSKIKLMNELGEEIKAPVQFKSNVITIDIKDLRAGYYFINLSNGEKVFTKQLIVTK